MSALKMSTKNCTEIELADKLCVLLTLPFVSQIAAAPEKAADH
jgi:hypothetical protein